MRKFKELVRSIQDAMDGRDHDVVVDYAERWVSISRINVPMLADIREIAEKFGAEVYLNRSWDLVEVEM